MPSRVGTMKLKYGAEYLHICVKIHLQKYLNCTVSTYRSFILQNYIYAKKISNDP